MARLFTRFSPIAIILHLAILLACGCGGGSSGGGGSGSPTDDDTSDDDSNHDDDNSDDDTNDDDTTDDDTQPDDDTDDDDTVDDDTADDDTDNSPPVITAIPGQSVDETDLLQVTVTVSDPDGDALTVGASNLPDGAVFDSATLMLSWVPSVEQAGAYTVTISASDGINPSVSTTCDIDVGDHCWDLDGDGHGDVHCGGDDCNDSDDAKYPGATERCNGQDDNCDDSPGTSEVDLDGDGVMVCQGDCQDGEATINPLVPEICDDIVDNDCDTFADIDDLSCQGVTRLAVRLNEVRYWPEDGSPQLVELKNTGDDPVDVSGFEIADEDGNVHVIPGTPSLQPGGYLQIEDLAFEFNDQIDRCALYAGSSRTPETMVDFVAWGADAAALDDMAFAAGLWIDGDYIHTIPQFAGDIGITQGGSIARDEASGAENPHWIILQAVDDAGDPETPFPAPVPFSPWAGFEVGTGELISFIWSAVSGAATYHLQVDTSLSFASPDVDVDVAVPDYETSLGNPGIYYWRVKAVGSQDSAYASAQEFTVVTGRRRATRSTTISGVPHLLQHKDSALLCLEHFTSGCPYDGDGAWDKEHKRSGQPARINDHDNMYCGRAVTAMVNRYFGGSLTQDEVSFQKFKQIGKKAEGGLGHGTGLSPHEVLSWALGGATIDIGSRDENPLTWEKVVYYIDRGIPIAIVRDNGNNTYHAMLLIGYNTEWINEIVLIDPWTGREGEYAWFSYNDGVIALYAAPASADVDGIAGSNLSTDSDADGIVNFDESQRLSTNPSAKDTDIDMIPDKTEVAYYNFQNVRYASTTYRAEQRKDADGGGVDDGCENIDRDRFLDAGETNFLDSSDDGHSPSVAYTEDTAPGFSNPCDDNYDNDCDGLIDEEDPDCGGGDDDTADDDTTDDDLDDDTSDDDTVDDDTVDDDTADDDTADDDTVANNPWETGQTHCYDGSAEIVCPAEGESYFGQDAQYGDNFVDFAVHGDGTVTCLNTGLMWQSAEGTQTRSWADSITYCDDLTLAGYTDWRLPSRLELATLVNYSYINPALNPGVFPQATFTGYWSSTEYAGATTSAWYVDFAEGAVSYVSKTTAYRTRCVREQLPECVPDCSDVECGPDGCGSDCGYCLAGEQCSPWGLCNPAFYDERFLPDTNQYLCYDGSGVIPCPNPGESYYGQDAQYNDTMMNFRATPLTVIDNVTDLEWQRFVELRDADWDEASSYCENLVLDSRSDWRLPTRIELATVVDYGGIFPAIDVYLFPDNSFHDYWASTEYAGASTSAWYVDFTEGAVSYMPKASAADVRCMRGAFPDCVPECSGLECGPDSCGGECGYCGSVEICVDQLCVQTVHNGRPYADTGQHACYDSSQEIACPAEGESYFGQDAQYEGNEISLTARWNDTVKDNVTGLIWQRDHSGTPLTWDNAVVYCDTMSYAGYNNWRLPTRLELAGIVDYVGTFPAIDLMAFPFTIWDGYWTQTEYAGATTSAWFVDFEEGAVNYVSKTSTLYVRCVHD